ncbi:MAG: hypothetical protein ACLSF2_02145 [Butyricicoccus sp.]
MMEMLTNLVTQSGVSATQLSAILLGVLFLIMIIGLATGQELAFVLGGPVLLSAISPGAAQASPSP